MIRELLDVFGVICLFYHLLLCVSSLYLAAPNPAGLNLYREIRSHKETIYFRQTLIHDRHTFVIILEFRQRSNMAKRSSLECFSVDSGLDNLQYLHRTLGLHFFWDTIGSLADDLQQSREGRQGSKAGHDPGRHVTFPAKALPLLWHEKGSVIMKPGDHACSYTSTASARAFLRMSALKKLRV